MMIRPNSIFENGTVLLIRAEQVVFFEQVARNFLEYFAYSKITNFAKGSIF